MSTVPTPSKSIKLEQTGLCVLVIVTQSSLFSHLHWFCLHQTPHVTVSPLYSPDMHQLPSTTSPSFSQVASGKQILKVYRRKKIFSNCQLLWSFIKVQVNQHDKWHFTWKENPSSNAPKDKFLPLSKIFAFTVNGTASLLRTALLKLNRAKAHQRETISQNSLYKTAWYQRVPQNIFGPLTIPL